MRNLDSNKSHHEVDLGKGRGKELYSDRGLYYMDKRDNPKSGIRKPTKGQGARFDEGYDRIFGKPKCRNCGAETLVRCSRCENCEEK